MHSIGGLKLYVMNVMDVISSSGGLNFYVMNVMDVIAPEPLNSVQTTTPREPLCLSAINYFSRKITVLLTDFCTL